MVKQVEIVNIRMPKDLIRWIDQQISKGNYKSRSEAIREFAREYVQQSRRSNV